MYVAHTQYLYTANVAATTRGQRLGAGPIATHDGRSVNTERTSLL